MKFNIFLCGACIAFFLLTGCDNILPVNQATMTVLPDSIPMPTFKPTEFHPTIIPTAISREGKLTVLAAASLKESFTEIGLLFEKQYPKVNVEFSFGGSQQLAQQILQGAPVDVFASASQKYMDVVNESGKLNSETQKTFAENKLVVIVPVGNPAGLESLADLGKSDVKLVLASKDVPVGQYSLDFLSRASTNPGYGKNYGNVVLDNVVSYEDNVKAVLAKVVLGEADAGIVYYSDVTGDAKDQLKMILIPDTLNTVVKYPIAAINTSKEPELSDLFIRFVLSKTGQDILENHGFIPASTK